MGADDTQEERRAAAEEDDDEDPHCQRHPRQRDRKDREREPGDDNQPGTAVPAIACLIDEGLGRHATDDPKG